MDFNKLIASKDYDFLRTDPHVAGRIGLITLGGSHAYGTNVEGSDVDIRGFALERQSDLIGFSNFEQLVNEKTDTVIYGFNKLIHLLLDCNPNIIEILGCKPEHYFAMSKIGKMLLDERHSFLSVKAANSFGGYATAQLRRLENAIARDKLPQSKKEEHILGSLTRSLEEFEYRYSDFPAGSVKLFIDKSERPERETEVFIEANFDKYPVRDFNIMLNTLSTVVGNYDKLNGRNHKKDEAHLNKHAMHLVRLYLMCFDILEKEKIVTYREKDRDFLLSIRNGYFMNEDGTYRQEFFDMISDYEKRLKYDKENTSLPSKPKQKQIEEFVVEINRMIVDQSEAWLFTPVSASEIIV